MSDVKMDKRPYHSPLRQEQAMATRQRILDAALELFGVHGYGATSIAAVAREAGVVPETIYATFGSKRGIVDGLIERAVPREVLAEIDASWQARAGDPAGQLAIVAAFATAFWGRNDALATVFRQGTGDADIGDEWSKRQGDRRAFFAHLLADWPDEVLRRGLDHDHAVDILWALATDEVFHLFVRERAWSPDAYEGWLLAVLRHEILAA
jgi:TetR/AcrR family transcriptional regulator, regulator of autoinduction and epiphytic fitness